MGAGHAVAVQNLAENSAMLLMIGMYILLEKSGTSVTSIGRRLRRPVLARDRGSLGAPAAPPASAARYGQIRRTLDLTRTSI